MVLDKKINFIRKISLSLFVFSLLSLLGSLWLQNTLADFRFIKDVYDEKVNTSKFFKEELNCSKNKDLCLGSHDFGFLKFSETLGECFINKYETIYTSGNKSLNDRKYLYVNNNMSSDSVLKPEYKNKNIEVFFKFTNEKNENCIKNYKYYNLYKIFPYYFEFLYDLKNISSLGSNVSINPFIYGEASISNIVKRFPINLVFKPLLFISVILMFLYWKNYNFIFNEILKSKNNKFVVFGLASAVFLFFHVLFLGMEIENEIFKLLRKLVIVLFILSEIIAQSLLSIRLFKK